MKIEILYPEICNLYGELGNMRYLKDCLTASGVDYEVVETAINERPLFVSEKPDLIYMGTLTENNQLIAIEALQPYRGQLIERIQDNTLFLITGNALEVFGHAIETEDGSRIPGLNLYNTVAKRKMFDRYNSLYWGNYTDGHETQEIFGFKSQFAHSYPEENTGAAFEYKPVFTTVPNKGCGLNPDTLEEGVQINRFTATYIIGPVLTVNPLFTLNLMKKMGIEQPKCAFEKEAMTAYEMRQKEFTDPDMGYTFG